MKSLLFHLGLFTIIFSSCASLKDATISEPVAVPSQTPTAEQPRMAVRASGWDVRSLKGGVAKERTEMKDSTGQFVTKYIPASKKSESPTLPKSFFTDDERRSIGLSGAFQGDLGISHLWVFNIVGKEFCYVLTVYPPGIGADIILHFYDLDGDGRFETAKLSSNLSPDLSPHT